MNKTFCRTTEGAFGTVQIAPKPGRVILDIQGKHWTLATRPETDHGYAEIDIAAAIKIQQDLAAVIAIAQMMPDSMSMPVWSKSDMRRAASRMADMGA